MRWIPIPHRNFCVKKPELVADRDIATFAERLVRFRSGYLHLFERVFLGEHAQRVWLHVEIATDDEAGVPWITIWPPVLPQACAHQVPDNMVSGLHGKFVLLRGRLMRQE